MAMKIPHTYPPISHTHCRYRGHRLWWAFLLSSLSVFLGGLLALLLWKVAHSGFNSIGIFRPRRQRWAHRQSISVEPEFNLKNALKEWAFSVISAQHLPGKVLMVLIFCFNIGSILTYIILSTDPVESCMKEYSIAFLVDLSFNICHLMYFGLRLENSGDPWLDFSNPQPLYYFDCVYFLVVTMSTVGYGDVEIRTTLGRLFVIIFIFIGLAFLQNVPNWDWSRGDAVICLAELKLGFMSQSCLVPGLSTLLANLFTMQSEIEQDGDTWQNLYREGLYNEIYTEHLSPSFIGIVLVNPPSHIKIKLWTLGFLIASNASDARSLISHLHYESRLQTAITGSSALQTRQSASTLALQDHVVVCVFGDGGSSLLGLGDFMMPLRASSLTAPELRTVVFLGDPHYFSREWPNIQYFPNIYFLPGSPLCGADLRVLRVERCAMVVVLSSLSSSSDIEPSMQDKDTIHFCVNLYHIRFSPEPGPRCTLSHTQSHDHGQGLELGHGFGGHNRGPSHDTLDFSHIPMIPEKAEVTPAHSAGSAVPLLVELVNSSNVCFVNEADSQEDFSSLTLTQGFSTYFNANVPGLICTLVTGGDTPLLEAQLAEDNQLQGGEMSCEDFKELFCQALDSLEILCFGLYRLLDPPNPSMKRFVITNPSAELPLFPSDRVFCSVPFHQSHLLTLRRAKTSHRL
ncbi:unnamed protein product [Coregonus sp. 'balchen']|nr:unnamed protein product [Coregonus sp. 'balchen']